MSLFLIWESSGWDPTIFATVLHIEGSEIGSDQNINIIINDFLGIAGIHKDLSIIHFTEFSNTLIKLFHCILLIVLLMILILHNET